MKRTPNIRFKCFDGEWEEKALGEIFDERNERSANGELLSVSIKHGVSRAEEIERTTSTTDYSHYKVVKKGDIAYNTMRMWQGACGHSEYDGIVSPAYTVVAPQNTEYAPFYSFMFRTNRMLHEFRIFSQGLTSDTWNIKYPIFAGLKIDRPKKDEQKCTAAFIEKLDTLISQRTKEVEKMRNIKRALLEKMFPQNGESAPQIRFKEFTDKYSVEQAKAIFESFVEKNHPELPVLSATQDKGMVTREDIGYQIAHNKSNEATYKRVLPGQFVIHLRSFQGGFAHSAVEGITSPAYDVFGFKENNKHDDYYWKYIFCSKPFIKRLVTVTYGIRDGRNVSYVEFLGLSFSYPKKEEQTKIAKLLQSLDSTISARDRQITLLKNLKLALLEQMFVNN